MFTETLYSRSRLGFGVQTGVNKLETDTKDDSYLPAIGFEARMGFKFGNWIPGIFTSGRFTSLNDASLKVDGVDFEGSLVTRLINYGLESRWEWETSRKTGHHYIFARAMLAANSMNVEPENVTSGEFADNHEIFLRGGGLALGYGRTFLGYIFVHGIFQRVKYDRGVIIERINDVDNTLFYGDLSNRLHESSFLLAIGLHNIL